MLKVWGRKNSSNVQKTMWAVGELRIAYERTDIGMEFGGNDAPAYRAMNPNGLVPTIQDGDFTSVGIEFNRPLFGGTLRTRHPRTCRSALARHCRPMDGLANLGLSAGFH